MAELVDAPDSKSGFRKKVQVRFLFWAHSHLSEVVFLCPEMQAGYCFQLNGSWECEIMCVNPFVIAPTDLPPKHS